MNSLIQVCRPVSLTFLSAMTTETRDIQGARAVIVQTLQGSIMGSIITRDCKGCSRVGAAILPSDRPGRRGTPVLEFMGARERRRLRCSPGS